MAINPTWGAVYNLADWLEDQAGIDATTIYVGLSADPTSAVPTTVTFRPYGALTRADPSHGRQTFQAIGRGPAAREQLAQCSAILTDLEATIDGVALTVTPLQSAPVMVSLESESGQVWTQNYLVEYPLG